MINLSNIQSELDLHLALDARGVVVSKGGNMVAVLATDVPSGSVHFITDGVDIRLGGDDESTTDEVLRLLRGTLRLRGQMPSRDQFDLDCAAFNVELIEAETGPDASLSSCDSCGRSEAHGLITGSSAGLLPMYAFKSSGLVFCPVCSRLEIKALKAARLAESPVTLHPP